MKRLLLYIAVVSLAVVPLAGCGPAEPPQTTAPPAETEEQPAAAQASSEDASETAVREEKAPPAAETPAAQPVAETFPEPGIDATPEVTLLDEEGEGRLYQVGTQLVCVMEGTPEQMGFQHGRLLAEKVRHIIKDGYMQKTLFGRGYSREYVNEQSERMEKHFPPEYIAEMNGIVEGLKAAGVDDVTYEEVRTGATAPELQHHDPDAPPGCTNFAVFGRWTPGGRLLHARNLDWNINGAAQDDAVILVWRPAGGTPFMMPTFAGTIGGVSGMNAKGITIGEMTSSTPTESFDGVPLLLLMRRVIEKGSTLEEAVAIMEAGPRTTGWNFVIGDAKIPDARALEVDAEVCEVFAPMDPKESAETFHASMPDAVRRTNHPCGRAQMEKVAAAYGPRLGVDLSTWDKVAAALPMILPQQNSWQRYDWLGKQIEARPAGIDVKEAVQLLSNGPVKAGNTLHSWVFDPANNAAYVAVAAVEPPAPATDQVFTRIDLAEWFN